MTTQFPQNPLTPVKCLCSIHLGVTIVGNPEIKELLLGILSSHVYIAPCISASIVVE